MLPLTAAPAQSRHVRERRHSSCSQSRSLRRKRRKSGRSRTVSRYSSAVAVGAGGSAASCSARANSWEHGRSRPDTRRSNVLAVGFPIPASSSQILRWGTPVRRETASWVRSSSSRRSRSARPSARRKGGIRHRATLCCRWVFCNDIYVVGGDRDDYHSCVSLPSAPSRTVLHDLVVPRSVTTREPRCPSVSSSRRMPFA